MANKSKIESKADHPQQGQVWDVRRVLRLYPIRPRHCLGLNLPDETTKIQYPCGNTINKGSVSEANVLLDMMGARGSEEVLNSERLEDLARLLLYSNWHRDGEHSNVDRVVDAWRARVMKYISGQRTGSGDQHQAVNNVELSHPVLSQLLAPVPDAKRVPPLGASSLVNTSHAMAVPLPADPSANTFPGLQDKETSDVPLPNRAQASSHLMEISPVETDSGAVNSTAERNHDRNPCEQQGSIASMNVFAASQGRCSTLEEGETRVRASMVSEKVLGWLAQVPQLPPNEVNEHAKHSPLMLTQPTNTTEATVHVESNKTAAFGSGSAKNHRCNQKAGWRSLEFSPQNRPDSLRSAVARSEMTIIHSRGDRPSFASGASQVPVGRTQCGGNVTKVQTSINNGSEITGPDGGNGSREVGDGPMVVDALSPRDLSGAWEASIEADGARKFNPIWNAIVGAVVFFGVLCILYRV